MGEIREFRAADIPDAADLWLRVFRDRDGPASKALRDYFEEIFFRAPWRDPTLPSLVYEDGARGVVGFLGVLPRPMKFRGEPIKVAVATQLAEDENGRSAYAAVKLVKKFFSGPQDLSFSDGANESSERLWQASGGNVALLYSLEWTRVLRPAEYARLLLKTQKPLTPIASALRPMTRGVDALVARTRMGPYWVPEKPEGFAAEDASEEAMLACLRSYSMGRALLPEYDDESFRWLLGQAGAKSLHGRLRKKIVRAASGEILGWYLYYARSGDIAEVLQFGGWPKSIRMVLMHLFHDAYAEGAVAVSGAMEPPFAKELAKCRCIFGLPGYGVLMQSKNADILNAIQQGNAFLSRLEGEWWARFSDPEWSAG